MGGCLSTESQSKILKVHDSSSNQISGTQNIKDEADFTDEDGLILKPIIQITQKSKQLATFLMKNFVMMTVIAEKLKETVFQQSTIKDMMKNVFDFVQKTQMININQNQAELKRLLTADIIKQVIAERMHHKDIIGKKQFKQLIERQNDLQQQICSLRLYYEMANAKKEINYESKDKLRQFFQFEGKNSLKKQGDSCSIKIDNNYRKLQSAQIDEAIFLEILGNLAQEAVQRITFKYNSTQQQFKEIGDLIINIFSQFSSQIKDYEYDLSYSQINSVATVSRRACDFYQNGVYILLLYLRKSCANLQKKGVSVVEIQQKLKIAIDKISKKYPPGSGLASGKKDLFQRLQNIQLKQGKKQFQPFVFKEYNLNAQNRSEELNSIILSQANIASRHRQDFQMLIIKTCLKKCILYKTGLKLDPSRPNNKATMRIQEKMLFKGDQYNQPSKLQSTIKETLQAAENEYKQKLSNKLRGMSTIKFTISDMLRGKCTFLSVQEILETINDIKQYIKAVNQQKNISMRIVQIQSRFTNPMPISDITLKIAINEEILTELQLTIQTNLATYFFAHKVYQLQRTQIFSKLKIMHNYQHQFRKDFAQLVKQRLEIASRNKQISINSKRHICTDFFGLSKVKILQFNSILQQFIQEQQQKMKISKQIQCFAPQIQDFIRVTFQLKMNAWKKDLGLILKSTLQNNHSKINNQMIFFYFLKQLQTVDHILQIDQFTLDNHKQIETRINKEYETLINIFLLKQFQIDYTKYLSYPKSPRIHFLFQFISSMLTFASGNIYKTNIKQFRPFQIQFARFWYSFPVDIIYGDASKQTLHKLIIYSKLGFKSSQFYRCSHQAIQLLDILITSDPTLKRERIQMKMLQAQYNLIYSSTKEVKNLQDLRLLSKQFGNYEAALNCSFLMIQANLQQSRYKAKKSVFIEQYQRIQQQSIVIGLPLTSREIIQSEIRIAKLCTSIAQTNKLNNTFRGDDGWNELASIHLSKAVHYLWNFKDILFMWKLFKKTNFQLAAQENTKIKTIHLPYKKLEAKGCKFLSYLKWSNLTHMNIDGNDIDADGCKYIREAQWPNLTYLSIAENQIGADGCEYLSQCNWPNLKQLNLKESKVKDKGCKYLIQGKWPALISLNLDYNQIDADGCSYLAESNWPALERLNLSRNKLRQMSCKYIASAKWPSLTLVTLECSIIKTQGCRYLSKASWPNLTQLSLRLNDFALQGMQHLSLAQWPKLSQITLPSKQARAEIDKFSPLFKQPSIKFI